MRWKWTKKRPRKARDGWNKLYGIVIEGDSRSCPALPDTLSKVPIEPKQDDPIWAAEDTVLAAACGVSCRWWGWFVLVVIVVLGFCLVE